MLLQYVDSPCSHCGVRPVTDSPYQHLPPLEHRPDGSPYRITPTPEMRKIEDAIRSAGGKLKESSMSADMTMGTSTVTFRLTLSSTISQAEIVKALAAQSDVTSVNIVE